MTAAEVTMIAVKILKILSPVNFLVIPTCSQLLSV
jgi:hypothetical protein